MLPSSTTKAHGTIEQPIVDSAMTEREAFHGLSTKCPRSIRERQQVVSVLYYSFDNQVHRGQLVLDRELKDDIQKVFEVALKMKFPIHSVIPLAHPRFRKDDRWDDRLSMAANNTSAFNYRLITGGTALSNHAYGRAVDINPVQNPYCKGTFTLPPRAVYTPAAAGTLTADHPITQKFLHLGWEWGGTWNTRQDYQHFEKHPKR